MKTIQSQDNKRETIVVKDFKPWGGKHCWTTALKNVLDYHGLRLSEEMLFGLGGGIGFIYWYMKFMPAPFIGTRYGKGTDPLVNTCERVGAKGAIVETASDKKGYGQLKDLLRRGEPAFLFVDMAYLPYMALPEMAHFGGHTVVVFALDEEQRIAHVGDRAQKPFVVSIDDLNKARNSSFPPFPPKNKLLAIEFPRRAGDLTNGIRESIRECCRNMLAPPIKNIGLDGILKWASLVPKWPQQFKGMNLLGCLFNVFLYIEISGTGGSAFRTMYAQFLTEAASLLNEPALDEVAGMFRESAGLWSAIAEAALPDSQAMLKAIRELSVKKNEIFEKQEPGALEKMLEINVQLDRLMKKAAAELEQRETAELLSSLQQKIMRCYETEKAALERLDAVLGR